MKNNIITTTVIGIAMLISSCGLQQKNKKEEVISQQEKVITVKTEKVQSQEITRELEYTANLIAFEEIHLAPSSPGRIKEILVEVGDRIKKGQLLVKMDNTQLQQAKTQYENALSNYKRIDTLYQTGSISEQQYEQAKTQYEIAKANLDFQKENTTLHSPLNGFITEKYYEPGEVYSAAPNTQAGKAAIISLMQINPLKAKVSIAQRYFPDIKEGMETTITTNTYPNQIFNGKIFRIYPTVNPATRTFQAEVSIPNNKELLRPGMFADIHIKVGEAKALVVPAIAILKQEGTNNRYVFIKNNDIAKKVSVTLGKRFDEKIEIQTNGVKPGDELIIAGQASLMDGSKIKVVE